MNACDRWFELTDRDAVGEELSVSEAQFVASHAASCAACGTEARLYAGLSSVLQGDRTDLLVASKSPSRGVQWTALAGGAAAAAAAAAVLAFVLWPSGRESAPALGQVPGLASATALPAPAPVRMTMVAGQARIGDSALVAGRSVHAGDLLLVGEGRACIDQGFRTTSCLDSHTSAALAVHSLDHRELNLAAGRVVCVLDEKHEGKTFSVRTRAGVVTATGTLFAVAVQPDGVFVRLHRGSVTVENIRQETRRLTAPASIELDLDLQEDAWNAEAAAEDLTLIQPSSLWPQGPLSSLSVDAVESRAVIVLDGTRLGPPPVSVLTVPGAHSLVVQAEGGVRYERAVRVPDEGAVVPALGEAGELRPPARTPGAVEPRPHAAAAHEPAALLARAQDLRAAGRLQDAAASYLELIERYSTAPEGRTALLSLGHLELGPLGRPQEALDHFEQYLSAGGRLSQEASYGRIQALQGLGRTEEAKRAISAFLQNHPESAQAAALRKRRDGASVPSP